MATGTIKNSADLSTVSKIREYNSGVKFEFKNGDSFTFFVGKLDATHNYVQFFVNDVDKGYITFTVSRNVG